MVVFPFPGFDKTLIYMENGYFFFKKIKRMDEFGPLLFRNSQNGKDKFPGPYPPPETKNTTNGKRKPAPKTERASAELSATTTPAAAPPKNGSIPAAGLFAPSPGLMMPPANWPSSRTPIPSTHSPTTPWAGSPTWTPWALPACPASSSPSLTTATTTAPPCATTSPPPSPTASISTSAWPGNPW